MTRLAAKYRWQIAVLASVLILAIIIPFTVAAVQNIFIGSAKMIDVQLGDTPVSQIYLGSELVWERTIPLTPPAGSDPPNIVSTNPATLDVYPTTGWRGDVISISSNALFTTGVSGVTVGGVDCAAYAVVSPSLITCNLPAGTSGATYEIAVVRNGTALWNSATYSHMKVTYFDPKSSSITISGASYDYHPDGLTPAACSAMTATNASGMDLPASIAYFRDPRNSQVYKVKKMIDGKCWMVDSLKYIDTAIANTSDGTTGMVYNQGDHRGNGGAGAYNTVNEGGAMSAANSDKAFYSSPTNTTYCYGATNLPSLSLTRCGYLYNWYAATAGTGNYAINTNGAQAPSSICPENFRLPSGTSNGSTATSAGTSYNASDFSVLNTSMNSGSLTVGNTLNYPINWRPTGAWGGVYGGSYFTGFANQGIYGSYWSSTAVNATNARNLRINNGAVNPGSMDVSKLYAFSVRCVMSP